MVSTNTDSRQMIVWANKNLCRSVCWHWKGEIPLVTHLEWLHCTRFYYWLYLNLTLIQKMVHFVFRMHFLRNEFGDIWSCTCHNSPRVSHFGNFHEFCYECEIFNLPLKCEKFKIRKNIQWSLHRSSRSKSFRLNLHIPISRDISSGAAKWYRSKCDSIATNTSGFLAIISLKSCT